VGDGRRDEPGEDDGSFIRPFIDQGDLRGDVDGEDAAAIRPYFLTAGRVSSADRRVRVETMVVARPDAAQRLAPAAKEQLRLIELAASPTSVVELSAELGVPVGVALVLVGDLARDGLLDLSAPAVAPCDDVALIRRLIDGVIAL
jgi:hypothetical protein